MQVKVDLVSDTGTRPSPEMREFMARAEVGDEQRLEDPSVNKLNEMVADLLGKEEAIYLPSGLMSNQISYAVHCNSGDEIIMDKTAHPIHYEAGATAAISGASIQGLDGERGVFSPSQLKKAIRHQDYHAPRSRLLSVEQTSNLGGGNIWPLETIRGVVEVARQHGMATHMDGARLLNAVVATNISAREYASYFDSVWIDLSKGLGAPVGSVLAGSGEFIAEARYWKQRLGGAMRQAGIIAAGGIYALEHNRKRLEEDNENAAYLARKLAEIDRIIINPEEVQTNIVLFRVRDMESEAFADKIRDRGVRFSVLEDSLRAVTHLDVERQDIDFALKQVAAVCADI